jgi:hypothetical protein
MVSNGHLRLWRQRSDNRRTAPQDSESRPAATGHHPPVPVIPNHPRAATIRLPAAIALDEASPTARANRVRHRAGRAPEIGSSADRAGGTAKAGKPGCPAELPAGRWVAAMRSTHGTQKCGSWQAGGLGQVERPGPAGTGRKAWSRPGKGASRNPGGRQRRQQWKPACHNRLASRCSAAPSGTAAAR